MTPTPVRHRLGRRGAFLLTGGIVWVLEALVFWRAPHTPIPHEFLLSHWWPAWVGALFAASAVSA